MLAETALALAAVSVLAVAAVPRALAFYRETALEYEAVQLVQTIRYAQSLSRQTSAWPQHANSVPRNQPVLYLLRDGYAMAGSRQENIRHDFLPGIYLTGSRAAAIQLSFSPEGGTVKPITLRLRHSSSKDSERRVIIGTSGRCRVERGKIRE